MRARCTGAVPLHPSHDPRSANLRLSLLAATCMALIPVAGYSRPVVAAPAGEQGAARGEPDGGWRGRTIIHEALRTPSAHRRLSVLTDTIGARLAGSDAALRAIAWAESEFEKDGIPVRLEPVMVPVWIRGAEHAEMIEPAHQPLVLTMLGGSVATPPGGIEAEVIPVVSTEQMQALGRGAIEGKIVLYDHPFQRTGDEMEDYGRAVTYRGRGASDAARLGAVASLIRSVGTASLRTPHTGALRYADDAPQIPAAALSIEDAMLIHRLSKAGHRVVVRLRLDSRLAPDREEANVVAEIAGRDLPEEIVLIGAHLDSWDVGTGAIDDGAGCVMVMETMRLIAAGPPPRRTVRAVLFANEENGLRGARAYAAAHAGELQHHVAAMEADSGAGRAVGLSFGGGEGGVPLLDAMMTPLLAPLGAARYRTGRGGADIGVLNEREVPVMGLWQDTTRYFDWHHTMADTLDKVDPDELQQATAVFAAATYALADAPAPLPRGRVPGPEGASPGFRRRRPRWGNQGNLRVRRGLPRSGTG